MTGSLGEMCRQKRGRDRLTLDAKVQMRIEGGLAMEC